jgi:hypothetical protein
MLIVCSLSSVIFFLNLLEVGAGSPQVGPILELVILSRWMCCWACRYSDPDSATSSFSILLGSAPHLDEQVALLLLFLKRFCRESHELITTQNHQWQSYFWYNCIADTIWWVIGNAYSMLSLGRWQRVMRHLQGLRNYRHAQRAFLWWWVLCLMTGALNLFFPSLHYIGASSCFFLFTGKLEDKPLTQFFLLAATWANNYLVNLLLWYVSCFQEL